MTRPILSSKRKREIEDVFRMLGLEGVETPAESEDQEILTPDLQHRRTDANYVYTVSNSSEAAFEEDDAELERHSE